MPATFGISRSVFLRVLGVCLLGSFLAAGSQVPGLIGSHGLTPIAGVMATRSAGGWSALASAPSLFWIGSGDTFVLAVVHLGALAGLLLALGVAPRLCCVVAYVVAVSLRAGDTVPFQWFNWPFDDLLTESAFLGVLLAPRGWWWPLRVPSRVPEWRQWLLVWLLFRVMFGPGMAKITAGGAWWNLSAVGSFVQMQPFPTVCAAWLRELPPVALAGLTIGVLVAELLLPWFFWWRGRAARLAAAAIAPLMLGIWLCGSFRGLNWLSLALLLAVCDDAALLRLLPARLASHRQSAPTVAPTISRPRWRRLAAATVAAVVVAASIGPFVQRLLWLPHDPGPRVLQPFCIASSYSMFFTVPDRRIGLVIQGSDDGVNWRDFEPRALVAAVERVPSRRGLGPLGLGNDQLGFAMWLRAYAPSDALAQWLEPLLRALARGEPSVRALFDTAPFADSPPRLLRAVRFDYRLVLARDGTWWQRSPIDEPAAFTNEPLALRR